MSMGGGDLVTVMTLDDFEFVTGLRRSANETTKFAGQVNAAGGSLSGGFGRAVGQMGFAAQDFSSVMSMGGKNALGRALMGTMNNVQMLGQAFGPAGMAITSVAGALGSIFIPKLFEAGAASDALGQKIHGLAEASEHAAAIGGRLSVFKQHLGHLNTVEAGESAVGDLSAELNRAENKKNRQRGVVGQAQQDLLASGMYELPDFAKHLGAADQLKSLKNKKGDSDKDPNLIEASKIADDLLKTESEISELRIKRAMANTTLDKLKEEKKATDELKDAEKARKEQEQQDAKRDRELAAQQEKDARKVEQIRKEAQSPFERAQEKIQDIMTTPGLDDATKFKASDKVVDDLAAHQRGKTDQKNAGVGGGAQAYEAIRESIREGSGKKDDDKIKLLKEQLEQAKKQAAAAEKLNDQLQVNLVGIG